MIPAEARALLKIHRLLYAPHTGWQVGHVIGDAMQWFALSPDDAALVEQTARELNGASVEDPDAACREALSLLRRFVRRAWSGAELWELQAETRGVLARLEARR